MRLFIAFPRIAGGATIVVGAVVLIGWMLDVPVLKSLHPDLVSMKANAALAFVLAGVSLLLHSVSRERRAQFAARFLGCLVFLIGLLNVLQYAFTWDLGIDQFMFSEPHGTIGTYSSGRMALDTAISFCLLGVALVIMKAGNRWRNKLAQIIALIFGLDGLLVLLAYFYGLSDFTGIAIYTRMALHTTVSFILLSLGVLCVQPEVGVMAVITGRGSGGYVARRLMVAAIGLPVLLGWLVAEGEIRRWYGDQFGEVIAATASVAIFVLLIWKIGRSLDTQDAERAVLQQALNRSETEFRELFDGAPGGYHEIDSEGRITRVNKTEVTLLGYQAAEMLGRFVWEFLDEPVVSRQSVLAKLAGAKPPARGVERLYRRKDLTTITVLSEDVLLQGADGRITGIRTTLHDITELKRSQILFRQSEERFRQVADNAGEWIWETDPHGLYTFSSSAVQAILGYHPEEIIGKKHFYDFFTPDTRDELKHAALNAFEQKEPVHRFLNTNLHKNGNIVILETTGVPVLDEKGELLGYRGTDTDITARKRAEDSLKQSVSLLQATLESTADGILVVDGSGRISSYNAQFAAMWNLPDDVVATRDDERALNHVLGQLKDPEAFISKVKDLYARPDENSFDVLEFKDGRIFERYSQPQRIEGKPTGRVWSFRNVTERMRAEKAVIASELELRRVWEGSFDGMRVVDGQGTILMVNEAYCTLIGKGREELVGKPFSIILVESLQRQALEKHKQRFSLGTIGPRAEKELELWDGRRVWFEGSNSYIEIEGRPKRLLSVFRDITERKRTEASLAAERSLLRTLIDHLPDSIYVKDAACRKILANPVDAHAMGASSEAEVLGKTDFDFYPLELAAAFNADDQIVIRSGQPVLNREEMMTLPDGTLRWLVTSKVPLRDSAGQVIGLVGISHDITVGKRVEHERELLLEELRTALENVKTLSGLVPICAHCKKIRDDKGFWNQLETYIVDHTDANLTHGICPDCAKLYFPGIAV